MAVLRCPILGVGELPKDRDGIALYDSMIEVLPECSHFIVSRRRSETSNLELFSQVRRRSVIALGEWTFCHY
jgi:hypothetical protein